MFDLGIINGLVFINDKFIKTNVYISDGIIKEISDSLFESLEAYDCKGNLVIPGIIDPHTHFDLDLGFTTSKDDFETGTKAAAYGGVTTIIDFLNPVDNPNDLEKEFSNRVNQAQKSNIDYKFHACLKNPKGEVKNIVEKLPHLGLNTVKIFTTYSDSNRRTYEPEIKELLSYTKDKNFTLTVHVENDDLIITNNEDTYHKLPINRPTISEFTEAIKLAELVRKTNGRLYMVHLSSGDTLKELSTKYKDILNKDFIVESCPHYFTFNNEVLNKENGYLYTMAPPLRSESEQKELNKLIDNVYTIGTDHCKFNKTEKQKQTLKEMPLGVGGVEESFRLMFTKFGEKIIPKMTSNVAKAHYLYPQKGIIKKGSDADMFIYELKDTTIKNYHSNIDHNIYLNQQVNGEVISTLSRGKFVIKNKEFIPQTGTLLNQGGSYESN